MELDNPPKTIKIQPDDVKDGPNATADTQSGKPRTEATVIRRPAYVIAQEGDVIQFFGKAKQCVMISKTVHDEYIKFIGGELDDLRL